MKTTAFYFALGRPFAPMYSAAMRLRERMYNQGILRSYRFPVPVISVGNLTLGGSGKTPMVQYLAREFQKQGYRPAIISRGYGGRATGKINIVSDGSTLLLSAEQAGDEPRLLAETLPGIPVLTGIVRRLPAQQAIDMGADLLLLDDGFQHLQIRRNVNLVLFSTDHLAGNSRVFPGGDLREPVVALRRATGFVMTGVRESNRERADRFGALLENRFPGIPVAQVGYAVDGPVALTGKGMLVPVADNPLSRGRWFAFAGIAHPASFRRTLDEHGVELTGFRPFDDHQHYSAELLAKLSREASQSGASGLITTEKDMVKLALSATNLPLPLLGLRMQVTADPALVRSIVAQIPPAEFAGP
jgi:tetraacyldisaccharide 4'-kinase